MASPPELSLDCKTHSYSMLLKSFGGQTDQSYKLEEFLSRLEEERLKIDAFKRELPLCMQLLTNAMEASRQQLEAVRVNNEGTTRPVLEEFIPMKQITSETAEKTRSISSDKANWMTSAQLWSQTQTKQESTITSSNNKEADIGFSISPIDNKQRSGGGAFLPFSKERNLCQLALASIEKETDQQENNKKRDQNGSVVTNCQKRESDGGGEQGKGSSVASNAQTTNNSTTSRKARRCWSPDLHRRFVNALQMLGGSQVATPKQIRELMKVDGLTNDEVKSHLQKYRLHTRRPSPSPQTGAPAPQLVVLGGIWVPPEYAAHSATPALYGAHPISHAPPSHYCAATPVSQEFYTTSPPPQLLPPPPPHHNAVHHLHMYKTAHGSPESESMEDGKSESSSWKAESGEKGLGEESNGSEITLKF